MQSKPILSANEISRSIERIAYQIIEKHDVCADLAIVGIERRGVDLAKRVRKVLEEKLGRQIPLGTLDINLYRDDWTRLSSSPHVGTSSIPFDVDKAAILLVDDVLYTGRTVRSALEALGDYGRPKAVELLVLIDRGHRELPIEANYIGRKVNTSKEERIDVLLEERDGKDEVLITKA